jgi:DNA-binding response OmpR family regulator
MTQAQVDPLDKRHSRLEGTRVLVVEDNSLLCGVIEETLRAAGCEVVGPYARLGEALAEAPGREVDIALLDTNLRGELVSPLALQLRERGVPFLITTAYGRDELPLALQSAAQLRKPYSDVDLLDGLMALIRDAARNI